MRIYNKYKIEHTDGTPLKGKKYFVLRLDSDDPIEAARVARAMRAYEGKPRNCDVGTAEEQAERFEKHCQSFLNREGIKACVGCPCCGVVMYGKCELAWEQMPYESEVEK